MWFSPPIAVLLCDEGVSKVDEHPGHPNNTVDTNERLRYQQSNANTLRANYVIFISVIFCCLVLSHLCIQAQHQNDRPSFAPIELTWKMGDMRHMSMTPAARH